MTLILLLFFLFGNIFIGVFQIKESIIKYFLIILLWVLIWGNYANADYISYLNLYNRIGIYGEGYITTEFLWVYLMKFSNILNLNYTHFLFIISLISFYNIIRTVRKYSKNLNLFFVLYTIYPFFLNAVQIRFFFASSIAILILKYSKDKYYIFKSFITLLIASFIHYSFFILVPFLFLEKINKKYYNRLILIISIVLFISFINNSYLSILSRFFDTQKIIFYLENKPSFLGFIFMVLIHFLSFAIFFITYKKIKFKVDKNIIEIFYKLNIYSFLLIPFYYINGNFMRIFQFFAIINYIFFIFSYNYIPKNQKIIFFFYFY